MCSLVEIERFLNEKGAGEDVLKAMCHLKDVVHDYQMKNFGSQVVPVQSIKPYSKASDIPAKLPFKAFMEALLCACKPSEAGIRDDEEVQGTTMPFGDLKHHDGVDAQQSSWAKKGWTIGDSQRNEVIDYGSDEQFQCRLKQVGRNWNLDIVALSNFKMCVQNGPIVTFGNALLAPIGERIHPDFNKESQPILNMIQDVYLPNPYHNALHGACVAHMAVVIMRALRLSEYMTPVEEFAYIIASLGHDAGHPGKTNAFLRSTQNPLALIYNDTSILENYHASLICHILRSQESFFGFFSQQEWENVRKRVIQLVLATDMMSHFTHVNNVKERRTNGSLDYKNNIEDLWLIMVLCIKAADIGHNFLPWCDHIPWTRALFEEFHIQGDEERLLSMPLLLFFDRTRSADIPDSQLGFFQGFTMPLVEELISVCPNGEYISRYVIKNAYDNLENWKKHSKRTLDEIAHDLEESKEIIEVEDALAD